MAFVTRSLAAAAARLGDVAVVAPDWPAQPTADGLFDVRGVPAGDDLGRTAGLTPDSVVIVDELGADMLAALSSGDFRAGFYLTGPEPVVAPLWRPLALVPDPDLPDQSVLGPYVPVNPLAAKHRHHGFGFTEYVLILSGPEGADPPSAADSIGAALPDTDVVVVGDAVASAWKGRALRGRVGIDTRTDLWRLMAHAAVCIDLAPGAVIGLECVEALRFGTPVLVPAASGPATAHANASTGHTFADTTGLVAAVLEMQAADTRARASAAGRRYADQYFGDPDRYVAALAALMSE